MHTIILLFPHKSINLGNFLLGKPYIHFLKKYSYSNCAESNWIWLFHHYVTQNLANRNTKRISQRDMHVTGYSRVQVISIESILLMPLFEESLPLIPYGMKASISAIKLNGLVPREKIKIRFNHRAEKEIENLIVVFNYFYILFVHYPSKLNILF